MTNFVIDIISDPVCPWCYIGKKRLEKAISLYRKVYPGGRHDTFTMNWKAFYLDPSAPARGIPHRERLLQKLKSNSPPPPGARADAENEKTAAQLTARLANIGKQEGISFTFLGKIGNTRSAHRAIAFSKTQTLSHSHPSQSQSPSQSPSQMNAQEAFVSALFTAFFESPTSTDITSPIDLAAIASSAGLDGPAMLSFLENPHDRENGGEEVDEQDRAARAAGVQGVPRFSIDGRWAVDGAGDVQDFLDFFVRVKEAERKE